MVVFSRCKGHAQTIVIVMLIERHCAAKAKKIREEEEATYKEADADFTETIEAIQTCITSLSDTKEETDKPTGSLLSQSVKKVLNLASLLVSDKDQKVLSSF